MDDENNDVNQKSEDENLSLQNFPTPAKDTPAKASPSGPSEEVLEKILRGKNRLANNNKDLDQNSGASKSRNSPSAFARRDGTLSRVSSDKYLKRGRQLINRYRRENSLDSEFDEFSAVDFVNWVLSIKPTLASSTWRVYRVSCLHTLAGKPDDDIELALAKLENDIVESSISTVQSIDEANLTTGHKTSAHKEKRFPKHHFDKVVAFARYKSRSRLAPVLIDWLVASINTGLRPVEWRATQVERVHDKKNKKDIILLYVLNAKTTNNRGNGVIRTLDISNLKSKELLSIERMSKNGLAWYEAGKFGTRQSQVSQLLYTIIDRLSKNARKKRYYSLYSCRHQFVANLKTVLSPAEVSALSGHSTTKTAQNNYGRASSAWSYDDFTPHVLPIAEEVATVKSVHDFYERRMKELSNVGIHHGNLSTDWPT
jgi:hypothetical protein